MVLPYGPRGERVGASGDGYQPPRVLSARPFRHALAVHGPGTRIATRNWLYAFRTGHRASSARCASHSGRCTRRRPNSAACCAAGWKTPLPAGRRTRHRQRRADRRTGRLRAPRRPRGGEPRRGARDARAAHCGDALMWIRDQQSGSRRQWPCPAAIRHGDMSGCNAAVPAVGSQPVTSRSGSYCRHAGHRDISTPTAALTVPPTLRAIGQESGPSPGVLGGA